MSVHNGSLRYVLRYCFVILVNIAGLYISGCRTGLLVTLSVLLLMFLLYKRYSLFLITIGILAVYVFVGLHCPAIMVREDGLGNDFANRLSIWLTTLKGILAHPFFGWGGNAYAKIFAVYGGYKAVHAHNLMLDILLNYGLVGFGLVLACFVSMFKLIRMGASGTFYAQVRHVVYVACWCVLVHGLVDVTIFWIQTGIVFLFIFSGGIMCEQYNFSGMAERRLAAGLNGDYRPPIVWPKSSAHRTAPRP
jgi:O-antigen ligase